MLAAEVANLVHAMILFMLAKGNIERVVVSASARAFVVLHGKLVHMEHACLATQPRQVDAGPDSVGGTPLAEIDCAGDTLLCEGSPCHPVTATGLTSEPAKLLSSRLSVSRAVALAHLLAHEPVPVAAAAAVGERFAVARRPVERPPLEVAPAPPAVGRQRASRRGHCVEIRFSFKGPKILTSPWT